MVALTKHAKEQSTYPITVTLVDGDGVAITPNNDIKWSLVDDANNVINGLEDQTYTPAASNLTIVLSGDDLLIQDNRSKEEKRFLVIECTYDSSLGTGLKFKDQQDFWVDNLHKVTA